MDALIVNCRLHLKPIPVAADWARLATELLRKHFEVIRQNATLQRIRTTQAR